MSSPSVLFTLRGLDTEVGLFTRAEYPQVPTPAVIEHHHIVSLDVSAADLNYVFWFRTTDPELTTVEGADDMEFATISENWYQGGASGTKGDSTVDVSYSVFVPSDGDTTGNPIAEVVGTYVKRALLKEIGVSRLARQITGGYNNSDIFTNETELSDQYVTLDASINTLLRGKLDTAGILSTPLANDSQTDANITRELLNYCLGSDDADTVHRVHDMINDASGGAYQSHVEDASAGSWDAGNVWVPFTFKDGDVISFQLKYNIDQITTSVANDVTDPINGVINQHGGVAVDASGDELGVNKITDQIFLVKMNIVGDDASRS